MSSMVELDQTHYHQNITRILTNKKIKYKLNFFKLKYILVYFVSFTSSFANLCFLLQMYQMFFSVLVVYSNRGLDHMNLESLDHKYFS